MVALCSSTLRSQSPGRKNDQVFSVYTLTHLLCAGVYIAVVASNSLQNYFTISPQLLTVISSLVSFSIHVLFFSLLNPCLIIPNSSLFITNERNFTSFLAFLASSLFLAASSLSARASAFLRSIVWLLLFHFRDYQTMTGIHTKIV